MKEKSRGLLELIVRHHNLANLIMAVMVLFGAYGLAKLNTQFFPAFDIDYASVQVVWSGASAEDVAELITTPIEQELKDVGQGKERQAISLRKKKLEARMLRGEKEISRLEAELGS